MQAVGKIGSYIGRSVYTVSGPFHPFGGAVDIIVVEQPDGTYKSSPWYVRFGKFQGVLKTKEKVVSISVNGVKSDFHMYLDHKGEAFFLKEVELEGGESGCSTPYSSDDSLTGHDRDSAVGAMTRTNSRRARILGLVFGRKLRKEELVAQDEEGAHDFVRTASLERAEIAADLLDLKWSTNLASSRVKEDKSSRFSAVHMQSDEVIENPVDGCGCGETGLVSAESNKKLESRVGENELEVKCSDLDSMAEAATSVESVTVQTDSLHSELLVTDKLGLVESDFHVSSTSVVTEVSQSHSQIQESVVQLNSLPEGLGIGPMQCIEQRSGSLYPGGPGEACAHMEAVGNIILKSEPGKHAVNEQDPLNIQERLRSGDQVRFLHEETLSVTGGSVYGTLGPRHTSESAVTECLSQSVSVHQSNDSLAVEDSQCVAVTYLPAEQQTVFSRILGSEISPEEQLMFGNLDDYSSSDGKPWNSNCADQEPKDSNSSVSSTVTDGTNEGIEARCSVYSLDQSVIDDYINDVNPPRRKSRSISSDISTINETGHARPKELIRMVRSLPSMELANDSHQLSGAQAMDGDFKSLNERREGPPKPSFGKSKSSAEAFGGHRRGWPFSFKRSRTLRVSHMDMKGGGKPREVTMPDNSNVSEVGNNEGKVKAKRKVIKMLTPTSEQLASLNLREGKNAVAFTFSTAMLGNQQVDARIFLWRWDTQIVISDVDGTITRSDLLGQVMPLVGMDWSQTGVANLFSAIKENGYQLLFLSARSISQSFHTRQFLCNIRQDGKALPEGPVVISPDGLFPSLYREVVRRAPHEFKIGCLEDIKALFPADRNPFYAGFGNRDTDELSYLKVGIPRGKIFTINPKGEIVVNHHVHTKSYWSLHDLVHGMFPTMTSFEQEDFNSWNYWKLPPPLVDL